MAKYASKGTNTLINKAIVFATTMHEDQVRKGKDDVPYIFHPFDVASEVIYYSGLQGEDLTKACVVAILHDTIEDTPTSYKDVFDEFGVEIADGVVAVSKFDPKTGESEDLWKSLRRMKSAPVWVKVVKLADRISNLKTFPGFWDRDKIGKYLEEAMEISDVLGDASFSLNARLLSRICEARVTLSIFEDK